MKYNLYIFARNWNVVVMTDMDGKELVIGVCLTT